MTARYHCLTCAHEWTEQTRGGSVATSHGPTACPRCGALWVRWTNYPRST
jgi:DNA-directed RNA polymerase subunit RPC12/RpoP